jgi:hypothetical protein
LQNQLSFAAVDFRLQLYLLAGLVAANFMLQLCNQFLFKIFVGQVNLRLKLSKFCLQLGDLLAFSLVSLLHAALQVIHVLLVFLLLEDVLD